MEIYFPKQEKTFSERSNTTTFANLFNWLAYIWILQSASAFRLLGSAVLVEVREEKPASHRHEVGKGRALEVL